MLTNVERLLAAALLELAAQEFSNHGCNDFRLRKDAGLSDDEAQEAIRLLNAWDRKNNPVGHEDEPQDADVMLDSHLMSWLADSLRKI